MKTVFTQKDVEKFSKELWNRINIFPEGGKIIIIEGEMGTGKTTFCSFLVKNMTGKEQASSPSFALVQVYQYENQHIIHFDFQRIEEKEAKQIFEEYEEKYPDAIFVIEWIFDGWEEYLSDIPVIHIAIEHSEHNENRLWKIEWRNPYSLPVGETAKWIQEWKTPVHVQKHIEIVRKVATFCAKKLQENNIPIDINLVEASSILHDAVRYTDFKSFEAPDFKNYQEEITEEKIVFWKEVKNKYANTHHGIAMQDILDNKGFFATGKVIASHLTSRIFRPEPMSWEEKCVYYADKRAAHDTFVTVEERLEEGGKRHGFMKNQDLETKILALEKELQEAGDWKEEEIQKGMETRNNAIILS